MPAVSVEKLIVRSLAKGLQRLLSLDAANCLVAAQRFAKPPTWKNYGGQQPLILVIAGACQPEGAGHGAQDGGDSQLRRLSVEIVVYHRSKVDAYGESRFVVIGDNSILDWCARVESVLSETHLSDVSFVLSGSGATIGGLLYERLRWEGQSPTYPEDVESGIYRRECHFSAPFVLELGPYLSLTAPATT